ncbi:MAG: PEP-CTERM sorting domain-containing protein [Verrucomicrobiota bacterium]
MKKVLCASLGLLVSASILQAQTIAQWTFETSIPLTAGPFSPEIGSGSALGSHVGAAVFSSPVGNGSAHSFSANTWAVNDFWLFKVSTTGLSNVGLSWDQTSSGTGPRDFSLDYSLNGGSSWTTVNAYSVLLNGSPNGAWSSATNNAAFTFSPNLAGAVDNQASVWFRLINTDTISASGGIVAVTGTDRVDNFTVAAIPEPTSLSLMGGFGLLAWTVIRRRK